MTVSQRSGGKHPGIDVGSNMYITDMHNRYPHEFSVVLDESQAFSKYNAIKSFFSLFPGKGSLHNRSDF
jgi:hypothetical protein